MKKIYYCHFHLSTISLSTSISSLFPVFLESSLCSSCFWDIIPSFSSSYNFFFDKVKVLLIKVPRWYIRLHQDQTTPINSILSVTSCLTHPKTPYIDLDFQLNISYTKKINFEDKYFYSSNVIPLVLKANIVPFFTDGSENA